MCCKEFALVRRRAGRPRLRESYGQSGLGTAGSGDTLTGLISGFLTQAYATLKDKADPLAAVIAALYVGGLAGDLAAQNSVCARWSLPISVNTLVKRCGI